MCLPSNLKGLEMNRWKGTLASLGAVSLLALMPVAARAESGTAERARKEAQIPHCVRPLGAVAVRLPPDGKNWWSGENLASPDTVIKSFVKQSNCFTLVDRGAGMALAEQERALSANGTLRAGANIGKGQVKAADYILVPSLLSKNSRASGNGLGGLLAFVPGVGLAAAAIASGISVNSKTADVSLSLIDVRSSEELATEEGHAKKKDVSWGAGGAGMGTTGLGAVGATGYADTEIGQLIMLAYLDAFTHVVAKQGGVLTTLPGDAAASAVQAVSSTPVRSTQPTQAAVQGSVTTTRATALHQTPGTKGKTLGSLPAGTILYPTGIKSGVWTEVTDEAGAKGWVSSLSLSAQ